MIENYVNSAGVEYVAQPSQDASCDGCAFRGSDACDESPNCIDELTKTVSFFIWVKKNAA
jgi:hypothetical protein